MKRDFAIFLILIGNLFIFLCAALFLSFETFFAVFSAEISIDWLYTKIVLCLFCGLLPFALALWLKKETRSDA